MKTKENKENNENKEGNIKDVQKLQQQLSDIKEQTMCPVCLDRLLHRFSWLTGIKE